MKVGFTGTQTGLTDEQIGLIVEVISELDEMAEMHHGDCIGADAQFFTIIRTLKPDVRITGHLPKDESKRAFCENDFEEKPLPYLDRNKNIVSEADVLIGAPESMKEKLRSGTWATIRHARKVGVPRVIIWPDGKYTYED